MMDHTYPAKHRTIVKTKPHGMRDVMDLKHHIHYLEIEAYSSILKAFIAQSDLLTWAKEELMTELRKELNVTDAEHGEILLKINSDELIKQIREQRKLASHAQDYIKASASASMGNLMIRLKVPSSATSYPQKKMSHNNKDSLISIPIPSSMLPKFNNDLVAAEFTRGNVEQSMEMFNYDVQLPPIGKGRVQKRKYQFKNKSNIIQFPATDRVIEDVEKMLFSQEKPDPVDIERAKWTLRKQEIAIIEALGKVADVLERGDASNRLQHFEVSKNTSGGEEMMIRSNFCGLIGNRRLNGLGDSF